MSDSVSTREPTHTFRPAGKYRLHLGAAGAGGFILFAGLLIYALVDIRPWEDPSLENLAIVGTFAFFVAMSSYLLFHVFVQAPANTVHINDDGVWLESKTHATEFVRWDDIQSIRERPLLQRLDLIGGSGQRLIPIDYHINDFDALAYELMFRTRPYRSLSPVESSHAIRPTAWYFYAALIAGLLLMGLLNGGGLTGGGWPYFLLAALVPVATLLLPIRLRLTRDHLELHYPLRIRRYHLEEIDYASLFSKLENGYRNPMAAVHLLDTGDPVLLSGFTTSALELYELIERWLETEPAVHLE